MKEYTGLIVFLILLIAILAAALEREKKRDKNCQQLGGMYMNNRCLAIKEIKLP